MDSICAEEGEQAAAPLVGAVLRVLHSSRCLSVHMCAGSCADAQLISTAVLGLQLLHGALAAVTGGGSNGSFVVGADDSTALRLIRPAILRLAGVLLQAVLAPGVTGGGMHRLRAHVGVNASF